VRRSVPQRGSDGKGPPARGLSGPRNPANITAKTRVNCLMAMTPTSKDNARGTRVASMRHEREKTRTLQHSSRLGATRHPRQKRPLKKQTAVRIRRRKPPRRTPPQKTRTSEREDGCFSLAPFQKRRFTTWTAPLWRLTNSKHERGNTLCQFPRLRFGIPYPRRLAPKRRCPTVRSSTPTVHHLLWQNLWGMQENRRGSGVRSIGRNSDGSGLGLRLIVSM